MMGNSRPAKLVWSLCLFSLALRLAWNDQEVDQKFKQGQEQYNILIRNTKMPRYSGCWLEALEFLQNGCKELTDVVQYRLALQFANCFLQMSGRDTYPCTSDQPIEECTKEMKPEAFGVFTDFFTHTHNMCHFLQAQAWRELTENTIDRLSDESQKVAERIENSNILQETLIDKQSESLKNQEMLIAHGKQLKTVLKLSADDVHNMLTEFKDSTAEQRDMIFRVFERVSSLQSLVVGEFTGFYSMIFYAVAVLICYILSSTPRTSGARFWLYACMTLNVIVERAIVYYGVEENSIRDGEIIEGNALVYMRLWWSRKIFGSIALLTLTWSAYRYKDYNKINNQLLMEIQHQNKDLKTILEASSDLMKMSISGGTPSPLTFSSGSPLRSIQLPTHSVAPLPKDVPDTPNIVNLKPGEDSDNDDGSSTSSGESDHTFLGETSDDETDTESVCSSILLDKTAMEEEMAFLHRSTPVKELGPIQANLGKDSSIASPTGRRGRPAGRRSKASPPSLASPQPHAYFLRSRRNINLTKENPCVHQESPGQFAKVVKHLGRLAMDNARKTQEIQARMTQDITPRNLFSN